MPEIRKSADLRNKYREISGFCHNHREPVFITKNGAGDLAVMSIDSYNELLGRLELYKKLLEGLNQINKGETIPETEMMKKLNGFLNNV